MEMDSSPSNELDTMLRCSQFSMLNGRVDGTWSLNGMSGKLHTDAKYRREIDTRLKMKMKICDGSMGAYYSSSNEIFIVIVEGRGI